MTDIHPTVPLSGSNATSVGNRSDAINLLLPDKLGKDTQQRIELFGVNNSTIDPKNSNQSNPNESLLQLVVRPRAITSPFFRKSPQLLASTNATDPYDTHYELGQYPNPKKVTEIHPTDPPSGSNATSAGNRSDAINPHLPDKLGKDTQQRIKLSFSTFVDNENAEIPCLKPSAYAHFSAHVLMIGVSELTMQGSTRRIITSLTRMNHCYN
ncbi:hypothetical protein PSTG_04669 [Puccinia striiformis f. sp. tritici PST-78]|uniref:Uncharacterized protein n=1 Tax=Puccinia striiformis f. sp. tritici PST-78 TaxID=1165861 RepID=A0A0L0VSI4_9BASI|nr:hypothetical protein PSTG_04669 [Puccinia striiformis f. sp. tritici PST-78]